MPSTPEAQARAQIDAQLVAARPYAQRLTDQLYILLDELNSTLAA